MSSSPIRKYLSICKNCRLRSVCSIAPVFLHAAADEGQDPTHPERNALRKAVRNLESLGDGLERTLLRAHKSDGRIAHLAGCLLSEHWRTQPKKMARLLSGLVEHGSRSEAEGPRRLTPFEAELIRTAALVGPPNLYEKLEGPFELGDEKSVSATGALRAMLVLLSRDREPGEWEARFSEIDENAFRASFVLREPDPTGDAIDIFWSADLGEKSGVFYFRRDAYGEERLTSIDGIRVDSLLRRLFKVFDTDEKKVHRLFAKICRYLNKRAKKYERSRLFDAFRSLSLDDLFLLGLYAPHFAKLMEKQLDFDGFYKFIKFLHNNKGTFPVPEGSISECHRRVFRRRGKFMKIYERMGSEKFKELCRILFRVAEAYRDRPYQSSLVFRVGETAYFLTALLGLNPKGLEVSLKANNPLAFIAYGMQPEGPQPGERLRKLLTAAERHNGDPLIARAVEHGKEYMATIHNFEDAETFEQAVL